MKSRIYLLLISHCLVLNIFSQQCPSLNHSFIKAFGSIPRDSAIKLGYSNVCECQLEKDTVGYLVALNNLTQSYQGTVFKDSLLKYSRLAVFTYQMGSFRNMPMYARLLVCFGDALESNGSIDSALAVYEFCKRSYYSWLLSQDNKTDAIVSRYIECLNSIALLFMDNSRWYEALEQFKEIFSRYDQYNLVKKGKYEYILSLDNYGGLLMNVGEYEQALKVFTYAQSEYGKFSNIDSLFYAKILNNIGTVYQNTARYSKALPFLDESFRIKSTRTDEKEDVYIHSLNNLAALYLKMDRYQDALPLFKRLAEITGHFGLRDPIYLNARSNLAFTYAALKDFKSADRLAADYLELTKAISKGNLSELAFHLSAAGSIYMQSKNYGKAISLLDSALKMYAKIRKTNTLEVLMAMNNLAYSYQNSGDYTRSIRLYLEVLAEHSKAYPDDLDSKFTYMTNLMSAYSASGRTNEALKYIGEASRAIKVQMQDKLGIQSNTEKQKYINTIDIILQIFKSFVNDNGAAARETYSSAIYDNELMMKGFLLSSDEKARFSIEDSRDTTLINLYNTWKDDKVALSIQSNFQRGASNLGKLKANISNKERELSNRSNIFNEMLGNFTTDWRKIKDSLKDGEVLVDFFFFRKFTDKLNAVGPIRYGAFVLSKESNYPTWVDLFSEGELDRIIRDAVSGSVGSERDRIGLIYGEALDSSEVPKSHGVNEKLFKLIWKPLEPYFSGAKKIYFVPVNKLGGVSLLALHDSKHFLIDQYQMEQLQNGMEVTMRRSKTFHLDTTLGTTTNAVLFGGISYNYSIDELKTLALSSNLDSTKLFDSLPDTRKEVHDIERTLTDKRVITSVYTDENATKEKVRSFDKRSPDIMLIATHGYFHEDSSGIEVDPLERAALVLAHGNYVLGGGLLPIKTDNGILTASEASLLDFRRTSLLILSACETGVGDIRGSEGIYGLQRGFRLAGADYIIATLWKVSDEATTRFMGILFDQLCNSTNSITQAFQATQNKMKSNFGYNPYYWGAFTLVH